METNTQSYPKKKKHPIEEMFFQLEGTDYIHSIISIYMTSKQ